MPACKEEDDILNEARLNVIVVDDLGNSINGAKIYIFDNQQAYENARGSGIYSSALDSATSVASGVTFILESNKEHWTIVKYFDSVRSVYLGNLGDGKIEKLEKQSVIDSKFFIAPISGNVSFWTRGTNKLPIKITFNNIPQTDITSSMLTGPSGPGNINASNVSVNEGAYNYYAIADNGCIWSGSVNVVKGLFHAIELEPCIRGRISFFAPTFNVNHGPITVTLDNNDHLGTITGAGSYTCGSGSGPGTGVNFVSVTRDINSYTYQARTQDGSCVWTGNFTINSDTCLGISLPFCTP